MFDLKIFSNGISLLGPMASTVKFVIDIPPKLKEVGCFAETS